MPYKTAEERAAYAREWRAKNHERAQEIDAAKREKKREENPSWATEKMREWRAANPDKVQVQAQRQSAKHSERLKTDPVYRAEQARKRAEYMAQPGVRERQRKIWKDWAKQARINDPQRERKASYKKLYDITVEQYDEMLAAQNGCCAVCGSDKPGSGHAKYFFVDHCHERNAVRQLLCFGCNAGIGAFKDDPEMLRKAAEYIERHRNC